MTKDNPRIIVNLNLTDEELENRVRLGVDDYINKIVTNGRFEELIGNRVDSVITRRIERLFENNYWAPTIEYNGKDRRVTSIIIEKVDKAVEEALNDEQIWSTIVQKLFGMVADVKNKQPEDK